VNGHEACLALLNGAKGIFRRSWPPSADGSLPIVNDLTSLVLCASDVLADDWEVEEETQDLTWTDVKAALALAGISSNQYSIIRQHLGFT
jgi:hypothetical protein